LGKRQEIVASRRTRCALVRSVLFLLRRFALLLSSAAQDVRETIVAFVTGVFVDLLACRQGEPLT
jgi:hypothetical protein